VKKKKTKKTKKWCITFPFVEFVVEIENVFLFLFFIFTLTGSTRQRVDRSSR